jgi:hypothetical protein
MATLACIVGVSSGASGQTPALFEWYPDVEGNGGNIVMSYSSELTGRLDVAPIRHVIKRESTVDAELFPVGPTSYPPVLVLHFGDLESMQIVFSHYAQPLSRDWQGVVEEIVRAWRRPAHFSPLGGTFSASAALRPSAHAGIPGVAAPSPLSSRAHSDADNAAAPRSFMDQHHSGSISHGHLGVESTKLGQEPTSGAVPASIGDEGTIAHAIVLFISHARVSKDCRGGRSRKAYRAHMTYTALAAMCAAAEAVVAADIPRTRPEASTGGSSSAVLPEKQPQTGTASAESPAAAAQTTNELPRLSLLSITPLSHSDEHSKAVHAVPQVPFSCAASVLLVLLTVSVHVYAGRAACYFFFAPHCNRCRADVWVLLSNKAASFPSYTRRSVALGK